MVEKGVENSRVKDLYDAWLLLHQWPFKSKVLVEAIRRTCQRRNTMADHTDICRAVMRLASADQAQELWNVFRQRQLIHPNCPIHLPNLGTEIIHYLHGYFERIPDCSPQWDIVKTWGRKADWCGKASFFLGARLLSC